ncbi:MAG: ABC transporter permease [Clostridiales bacterium]|nr:ABC transporter permease [Clostridiales bacterium]MDR2750519.1 ABC transporter permease [Clostridiales bacterium]
MKTWRFRKAAAFLTALPLYVFTIAFVAGPLVLMVAISFLSRGESWGYVLEPTLRNYKGIFEPAYTAAFAQSIKLALVSTVASVLVGYPFGYFMARLSPEWRSRCMVLLIIPFWTSSLMRLYGWMTIFRANGVLDSALMAIGVIKEPLKLLYSFPAVAVGMVYTLVPFMIYSVFSSAEKLDWSLVEAARDLGASPAQAFLTVILPLTMPGLYSGIVLTFIPSMGLYFIADLLGGSKIALVGNIIQEQMMRVHNMPLAAAFSVVLMGLTSLCLLAYRKLAKTGELEGLIQ